MDEVRKVSNRMTATGAAGMFVGFFLAIRKGLPAVKTALTIGMNCAMIGTTCFGFERVSNVGLRRIMEQDYHEQLFMSHAIGGAMGGALLGGLFQRRFLPGIMVFTPAMIAVAFAEIKYEEARAARIKKFLEDKEKL
mmetsp:Transcript_27754/g.41996  ORF Transcript_27754/g.41996 Transcript_27754/m.41996 type:complete len:137 (-) Transcript_27754:122-532(-)|eukprot:CAMPEP_0178908744 /NCGR_PEP_ID=MMETSP0786-20121207/8094_1 /TAXON_ID=186022 /ORGANISM="Thalassionema frauenfeldii, Strain CCMP 1798" /LENGTH=136 /DNA_ID=CAMNT_0020580683 /DNA_START=277 /DNA_END=687 /DNA_ORIENTATION=-